MKPPIKIQTQAGFSDAVTALSGLLFSVSYSILHDRDLSNDAVQNAILRAWRKRSTVREPEKFKTWIARIAINESKRLLRAAPPLPLDDTVPAEAADPTVRLDVMNAVLRLDEKYRTPTVLYYFEDLSVGEIAETLHAPKGTIVSRLSRAREQLRKELNAYDV